MKYGFQHQSRKLCYTQNYWNSLLTKVMAKKPSKNVPTLLHFTSSGTGNGKSIAREVVQPKSSSAKFLEKMEVKRLAQPTKMRIDLRGKVKDPCFAYDYLDITHYMNSQGIEIFENEVRYYKGLYTVGVFEKVLRDAGKPAIQTSKPSANKTPVKKKITPKTSQGLIEQFSLARQNPPTTVQILAPEEALEETETPTVDILTFGYTRQRSEDRLNYIMPVEILNKDDVHIKVKSIDISVSGLRIKTEEPVLWKPNDQLLISFPFFYRKVEENFEPVHYRLIEITTDEFDSICRLQLIENPVHQKFKVTLEKFISSNRMRYKIDLGDTIDGLKSLVFEQIYSQSSDSIPLFFSYSNNAISLKYVLQNESHPFFENSLFNQMLKRISCLLTQRKRNNSLIKENNKQPENIYIYTFDTSPKTKKNSIYLALESDFSTINQLNQFLEYAMSFDNFQAWKLVICPVSEPSPTRIQKLTRKLTKVSPYETETLLEELREISALCLLIKLNNHIKRPKKPQILESINGLLEKFLTTDEQCSYFNHVDIPYKKRREENRYFLTTDVNTQINGTSYSGKTIDFSPGGVKIIFNQPVLAELRDNASITFAGLQKKFKKAEISKQKYRLAHISNDMKTISFSRDHRYAKHAASIFFKKIIENNKSKLGMCSSDIWMQARSELLDSILSSSLTTLPFFIQGDHKGWNIKTIAINNQTLSLANIFKHQDEYDLSSLINKKTWDHLLSKCIDVRKNFTHKFETELYLYQRDPEENSALTTENAPIYESAIASEFVTEAQQIRFIKKALKSSRYYFLRLVITPAINIDTLNISQDIREIRSQSKNQAIQFIEQLNQVGAIGELIDLTQIIARRAM